MKNSLTTVIFAFYCKAMMKSGLQWEGLVGSYVYAAVSKERSQGRTQAAPLEAGAAAEAMLTGSLLKACSGCFLTEPRVTPSSPVSH